VRWSRFFALAIAAASRDATAQTAPGELRDLAPPVEMPPDPVWHLFVAGAICTILLGAGIVFAIRRLRPVPVVRPVPPQETALEALRELETADADPKAFYIRLIEILRAYMAGRFGIDEPDATGSELLALVFQQAHQILPEHRLLLRALVDEADLVKFAGRLPQPHVRVRALAACRDFVRRTAVPEEAELAV
jgi:Domain of unknown function (DUF4381)